MVSKGQAYVPLYHGAVVFSGNGFCICAQGSEPNHFKKGCQNGGEGYGLPGKQLVCGGGDVIVSGQDGFILGAQEGQ